MRVPSGDMGAQWNLLRKAHHAWKGWPAEKYDPSHTSVVIEAACCIICLAVEA